VTLEVINTHNRHTGETWGDIVEERQRLERERKLAREKKQQREAA
jgi:hypothetical protein